MRIVIRYYLYGNKTVSEDGKKYYEDGEEITDSNIRPCTRCGNSPTKEGHDACLGNLPGVSYACCGHGKKNGYITFNNGKILRFESIKVEQSEEKE